VWTGDQSPSVGGRHKHRKEGACNPASWTGTRLEAPELLI